MFSGMPRIVLGHGAQHCGFVRTADKDLAEEFPRVNRFQAGEAMVARHQDDQRLVVHYLVAQVEGRLDAQEGHVEPAAGERLGEVRRIVARDRDLDVFQLVAQQMHGPRQPVHLVTGLELCGPARRFHRGIDLRQRQPGMVEKGLACGGQFDAAHAAAHQLDAWADFIRCPAVSW